MIIKLPADKSVLLNKALEEVKNSKDFMLDEDDCGYGRSAMTLADFEGLFTWLEKAVGFKQNDPRFIRSDMFEEWRIFFCYNGYRFIWRMSLGQGQLSQLLAGDKFFGDENWPSEKFPMKYEPEFEYILED